MPQHRRNSCGRRQELDNQEYAGERESNSAYIYIRMERRRTVFDADYRDGICDHGEYAIVVRMNLVRDVAVNEDIAWT
jgi:hypothetical protein